MVNIFPRIPFSQFKIGKWGSQIEDEKWISTQPIATTTAAVMQILATVPRIAYCRPNLIKHSQSKFILRDGTVVKTWKSPLFRDDCIFLADPDGKMIYGGCVWKHKEQLQDAIELISIKFT
ncbi:hypothetical protein [Nostoc sp. FACHB-110]|uniref:hypothetical protein n=1 Tax=Nostoc sp. FACHB-110 TaxID=2692834 RepID=UPI001687180D|nr:hypothetical protein [Nostoc sp. FACHB-110]MBD2440831.1 hypothetical protein [Nostoc sp. FACHB-110]